MIPAVDPFDLWHLTGTRKAEFAETIGRAFRDIGFVFVHVPHFTMTFGSVYEEFKKVFSLPEEMKAHYARPDLFYQRGWTPPFSEVGIACRHSGENGAPQPDAKENWFMGPDIASDHPLKVKFPHLYHDNLWPTQVPGFEGAMKRMYVDLYYIGKQVLRGVALYLGYKEDFFEDVVRDSPTVMRAIHYPPLLPEQVGKVVWGCRHTDINFLTVLPASTKSGLWIRKRGGKWIQGSAPEGCVIAQVGDMLKYLTGGHFLSAVHEVRAPDHPTDVGRLSAALFIHPRSDFLFQPDCRFANPRRYPPILAADLLIKRLKAIGLAGGKVAV